ncbi:cytokinin dehydrogenase 3-like protein [Tanacetum coccineum]
MWGEKMSNVLEHEVELIPQGIGVSKEFDDTMNEDTPVGVASTIREGVTPSVVDMIVEKEKIYSFKPSGKKVNVHTLFTPGGNGIDVVVLVDSIRAISERFANTAYGFFLGKKVAYPVVANYKDVSTIPVWVKLHGISVTDFSEDGMSTIATKLGTPLMLDSYTSDMCLKSWGRSSYARVMIEL